MKKTITIIFISAILFSLSFISSCATSRVAQEQQDEETPTRGITYNPGSEWKLAWSDEFNGDELDMNIWTRQVLRNPFNNEWAQYTGEPETAYLQDGYMVLKAERTGAIHADNNYTSARVISNPGGNDGTSSAEGKTFKYGKIAARIQLPYGKGIWPAFWMLGNNISETGGRVNWPSCGEIDILESGSKYDNDGAYGHKTIHGTIHYDTTVENTAGNWDYIGSKTTSSERYSEKFHFFEIEWTERALIWRLDGEKFHQIDISDVRFNEFRKPFYVLFNIAVGGDFTYSPDSSTPFPQYMYVDWIRHYTK